MINPELSHLQAFLEPALLAVSPAHRVHHAPVGLAGAVAILLTIPNTAPEESSAVEEDKDENDKDRENKRRSTRRISVM